MLSNGNRFGTGPIDLFAWENVPPKNCDSFPVNVEIKKTELNPPRELGLRLAGAFPGAMDDLVVAMRRLRLGIRHSNADGRTGHAKFVLQFPHCD